MEKKMSTAINKVFEELKDMPEDEFIEELNNCYPLQCILERGSVLASPPLKDGLSLPPVRKPRKKKATFFTNEGTRYMLNRYGLVDMLEKWRLSGANAILSTHKYGYKLKVNSVGWVVKGANIEELIENLTDLTNQILKIEEKI